MDFDTKKLKVMGAMRDADILESFDILQDDNDALCLQSAQQIVTDFESRDYVETTSNAS